MQMIIMRAIYEGGDSVCGSEHGINPGPIMSELWDTPNMTSLKKSIMSLRHLTLTPSPLARNITEPNFSYVS